jgi:hypothetical protein
MNSVRLAYLEAGKLVLPRLPLHLIAATSYASAACCSSAKPPRYSCLPVSFTQMCAADVHHLPHAVPVSQSTCIANNSPTVGTLRRKIHALCHGTIDTLTFPSAAAAMSSDATKSAPNRQQLAMWDVSSLQLASSSPSQPATHVPGGAILSGIGRRHGAGEPLLHAGRFHGHRASAFRSCAQQPTT